MNDIRSRVDAIEHRFTWDNYVIPGGQNDIIECDFFDPTYSPRRNPKMPSDTLSTISHESSVIDFGVQDKTNDIIEIHKQEQPIIAAAPSVINDDDTEGDADEHEIIIEEEKVSVGEAVEEEEAEEEVEEEVVSEKDENEL